MKLFGITTVAVFSLTVRTECSSVGSDSVLPDHWYPSLIGAPNLTLPASQCPSQLKPGYFAGSMYDSKKRLMVEIRVLSDNEAAVSAYFRDLYEIGFIEIPSVTYTLSLQKDSADMPICVMLLEKIQSNGTRVRLFPGDFTSIESADFAELAPEFGGTAGNRRPGGVVASPDLIYGIVPMQRITTEPMDWISFLRKEMEPLGVTDLPPSVVKLISERVTPTKSGAYLYSSSSIFLVGIILIAFMSL